MLNLSKTCHYALRALIYLARNNDEPYIKIEEIAQKENLPLNFLSKIFQILVRNNLVDSRLGPKGGVRISLDSSPLTVADVITTIDGKINLGLCALFGYKDCPEFKRCPIQNECKDSGIKIWNKLKKMRLDKL